MASDDQKNSDATSQPLDIKRQGASGNAEETSRTVELNPIQADGENSFTTKELEIPANVKLEDATRFSERLFREIGVYLQELVDILPGSLRELADDQRDPFDSHLLDLLSNLKSLLVTVRKLQTERSWDRDLCVSFISGFLHRMVTEKAGALQDFVDQAHCQLNLNFRTANITDLILSRHMKKMDAGDSYDVISDLTSWQDNQLADFRRETELAVARGVKVRRVFNLKKLPPVRSKKEKRQRILEYEILGDHLKDSQKWNANREDGYEVRVFSNKDFEKLKVEKPQLIADKVTEIKGAHFGVFSHHREGQRTAVEYQVTSDNLTELILWKSPTHIESHLDIFTALWQATPPRTAAEIQNLTEVKRSRPSPPSRQKQITKRIK